MADIYWIIKEKRDDLKQDSLDKVGTINRLTLDLCESAITVAGGDNKVHTDKLDLTSFSTLLIICG